VSLVCNGIRYSFFSKGIQSITESPYSHVRAVKGTPYHSHRIGKYRVVMEIVDEKMIIHVINVGHRSTVYRDY